MMWVKHLTVSYLEVLQSYGLHSEALMVRSSCPVETIKLSYRLRAELLCSGCGKRNVDQGPCQFCKPPFDCVICFKSVKDPAVKCDECGHALHTLCANTLLGPFDNFVDEMSQCPSPHCLHSPCSLSTASLQIVYRSELNVG
ncbi:hypothetical protein BT69DRAFT_708354 [Atractiella rhizophila]|nr:hypothetical protein BT69DRAFT_708354 [Atractiella rhizophila]